jgi:MFS family permease
MLPAVFAGVIEVLEPLRLSELGTSGPLIGAVFVTAAVVEAVVSPAAGRLSDRSGRVVPLRAGLAAAVVIALLLPMPRGVLPVAACVVLAFAALGMCWAPAMAFLSDAADGANLPFAMTFSLANVAWATGHMLGSAGGAPLAGQFSNVVPYAALAGLGLLTLVVPLSLRPSLTEAA